MIIRVWGGILQEIFIHVLWLSLLLVLAASGEKGGPQHSVPSLQDSNFDLGTLESFAHPVGHIAVWILMADKVLYELSKLL